MIATAGICIAIFLCSKENPLHTNANIDATTSASSVVGSPGDPIAIAKGSGNYLYAFMLRQAYAVVGKKQTQLGPKDGLYSKSWPKAYQNIGTGGPGSFLTGPYALTAGKNSSGKMFVFAVSAENSHVYWTNENTAGDISSFIAWTDISNNYASAGRIKCNTYPDGSIAVFGVNSADNKIFVSRRYNGLWQHTYPIGDKAMFSAFDVVKRKDGRLMLIVAVSGQIYSITQNASSPYSWPATYSPVGGPVAVYPGTDMHAILNGRDSVQIFAADELTFSVKTIKQVKGPSGEKWEDAGWAQIASYIPQYFELVRDNSSPKKIIIMYDSSGVENSMMAALKEQSNSRSPYVKFTTDPYPNELVGPAIDFYHFSFAGFNYSDNGTAAFFVNFHHPITHPEISYYDIYNISGSASGWSPNEWNRLGYPSEPPILP